VGGVNLREVSEEEIILTFFGQNPHQWCARIQYEDIISMEKSEARFSSHLASSKDVRLLAKLIETHIIKLRFQPG
jgi:hypothetical protein